MHILQRITLNGYKSIKRLEALELRHLNVMIGVNGAGKSNLVSFFKLLNEMMGERLQAFIASSGRAQSLLYFGPKITPQMEATLVFRLPDATNTYSMRLFHVAGDTLAFAEEKFEYQKDGFPNPKSIDLGIGGYFETLIRKKAEDGETAAIVYMNLLNRCRVFHFHDTSSTARLRQYCYIGDDRFLMPDGGNLAAILYRLRDKEKSPVYRRIIETVQQIAPFFADFELHPSGSNEKEIILNWRQKDSEQIFGPHQFSDGTLRAIALVTLLLQPIDMLPNVIIVDEPELGLHPSAQILLAGMLKKTSNHCQVIVATQSAGLLDSFEPEDVIVVERTNGESLFRRLDPIQLEEWRHDYSLGQLWEKNVIGGGPFS